MQMLNVKVDEYGSVRERGIHDAQVDELHFVANERLDVHLRDPAGGIRLISLRHVERIGFKDVVNGAIISDVFCWRLNSLSTNETNEAWRVLLGGNYVEAEVVGLISSLIREYFEKSLVLFESSYGGSIAAICGTVLISGLDEQPTYVPAPGLN